MHEPEGCPHRLGASLLSENPKQVSLFFFWVSLSWMYIPWEVDDERPPLVRKKKRSSSDCCLPELPPIIRKKKPRSSSDPTPCHEPGWYIRNMLMEKEDGTCLPAEDEQHLRDVCTALTDEVEKLDTKEWPKLQVRAARKKSGCGAKRMVMKPMEIVGNSCGRWKPHTRVRLWTYGRKTLARVGGYNHIGAVKRLRDHAESSNNNFSLNLSVEAMRGVLKYKEDRTSPIVMNCRDFFEDSAKLRGAADWHHTGKHNCNVQRLFVHNRGETMRCFLVTLQSLVRTRQRNKKNTDPDILDICLECNKGRDRSVGCAVALENAFKECGWHVTTQHLCESGWIYKYECAKCAAKATNWADPHAECPHCTVARSEAYVHRMMESGSFDGLHFPIE